MNSHQICGVCGETAVIKAKISINNRPKRLMNLCLDHLMQSRNQAMANAARISSKTASQFEKKHGTLAFLKVVISSMNHVLVNKGICTEAELVDAFDLEVSKYKCRDCIGLEKIHKGTP